MRPLSRAWGAVRSALILALAALAGLPASAFTVTISPGSRVLYLQVGTGTFTGTFSGGGTPGTNTTVNRVSVTVAPLSLGTGSVAMISDSAVSNSAYDGRAFCTTPAEVYVGAYFRGPASIPIATLGVTTPAALTSPTGDSIPFSSISWTSSGAGDVTPTIPSGTFVGGAQTLLTIARNTWAESCMAFRYANGQAVAAGTYSGRATYTLATP